MNFLRLSYLIILITILAACTDAIVDNLKTNDNVKDFETAWQAIDSIYPLLEYKQIDWDSIYTVYRARAERSKGDEFKILLVGLLRELRDFHVLIISNGGGQIIPYVPPRLLKDRDSTDPLLVRKYINKELILACDKSVEYEILDNNIGYMGIAHFNGEGLMHDFYMVMEHLRNTKGMIIDVRGNTGGWLENYNAVVSRFTGTQIDFLNGYSKGEVPYLEDPILPDSRYFSYLNPVVVLINGTSLSAGEVFPELMRKLPTVTLVGDTTMGAGANDLTQENIQGEYKLDCGFTIRISTVYVTRNDGKPIEWNGVLPDIRVPQTAEDIKNGKDKQLEYAISLLD